MLLDNPLIPSGPSRQEHSNNGFSLLLLTTLWLRAPDRVVSLKRGHYMLHMDPLWIPQTFWKNVYILDSLFRPGSLVRCLGLRRITQGGHTRPRVGRDAWMLKDNPLDRSGIC